MLYHSINIWAFILHPSSSGLKPRKFWHFKQVKLSLKYFNINVISDIFVQKIYRLHNSAHSLIQGSPSSGSLLNLLSSFLFIRMFIMIYLLALDDSLTS